MDANIKPQLQGKYIDTAEKKNKSVFKAEKGYPALLTNSWTESYIVLGPIQPGKQNQQIKHPPIPQI